MRHSLREKTTLDLSIVTPVLNQGAYLARTIESVLAQYGDFSLDYIIMDGGSSDESIEIVRQFEQDLASGKRQAACRELSFRWFSERDRGTANAINKGFALAEGRVLSWLNPHDVYFDDQALSTVVSHFNKQPQCSFAYGRGTWIDRQGVFQRSADYVTDFNVTELPEINFVLQPAAFWKRALFEQVGPLDESLQYVLDWDYWLRCGQRCELQLIDKLLACQRDCELNKATWGSIQRKAEIAALLLKYGGFTQRAIDWFLADQQSPQPGHDTCPAAEYRHRTPLIKKVERAILSPTRLIERTIRRSIKRRRSSAPTAV